MERVFWCLKVLTWRSNMEEFATCEQELWYCKKEEEVFQAQDGKFSRGLWHRVAPEWAQDQCWSSRQWNQVEQPSRHGRTSTKHSLWNQQRPVEQQGIHYQGELQGLWPGLLLQGQHRHYKLSKYKRSVKQRMSKGEIRDQSALTSISLSYIRVLLLR